MGLRYYAGGNMKILVVLAIAGMAAITGACSDSFLVYKQGRGYFLENNSETKHTWLCKSGELEKVLADTRLDTDLRDRIYRYNCSEDRSKEKILETYSSMTIAQRTDLKNAFKKNGYEINHGPECCGP